MKTIKKISIPGAVLLMATSIGSAYADEGEMTQTRERSEFNLQTPTSDFGQSRTRERNMVTNEGENQHQYQFKHMNQFQNAYAGENTMSRSMQNSAVSNSMGGGRR